MTVVRLFRGFAGIRVFPAFLLFAILALVAPVRATTWTPVHTSKDYIQSIATNGSQWVAVGNNGLFLSSPDGQNWTRQDSGKTTRALYSVAWNGVYWAATGPASTLFTSPDGMTWTQISPPPGPPYNFFALAWNGLEWLAMGQGRSWRSSDGVTWTIGFTGFSSLGLAWGDSQWVAGGASGVLRTSPDGVTWTSRTSNTSVNITGVGWNGSQWVLVGNEGVVRTSSDAVTWASHDLDTAINLRDVSWDGSRWIVGGDSGLVALSVDGETWELEFTDTPPSVSGARSPADNLVWGSGQWLAVMSGAEVNEYRIVRATPDELPPPPANLSYGADTIVLNTISGDTALTPVVAGAVARYSVSPALPAGLSLEASTGVIAGAPSSAATSTEYVITASNAAGSVTGSFSLTVLAPSAPDAPVNVAAAPGNAQATVSWSPPEFDGLSAITGYTARTVEDTTLSCATAGDTSCTVTGLTNGTAYTFTVTATNDSGTSAASTASEAVTPIAPPGAPAGVTAAGGNASATVSWSAPADNGGSAVTGYTITSSPEGLTCATEGDTTCTVTGLTNGVSYTFTVTAANAAGTGEASAASATVVPAPITPGAPTNVSVAGGNEVVTVSWSAPADDGGSPVTAYAVTSSPGDLTCATAGDTTCTVTGLANGTAYTFAVTATNAVGTGNPSAPSAAVTPSEWIPQVSGTSARLSDVAWNGSLWVAVGENGTILTSPDGITWTGRSSGTSLHLNAVAWGSTQWVIAGNGFKLTSPDGITWTSHSTPNLSGIDVAWNGRRWVSAGDAIESSPDGATWTTRVNVSYPGIARKVAWNGSAWMSGLERSPTFRTSLDGDAWTSMPAPITNPIGLMGHDSQWVVINRNSIARSADGINWTVEESGTAGMRDAKWDGSRYVAVGINGMIATSPDAVTWTNVPSGTVQTLQAVEWGDGIHITVGDGGVILRRELTEPPAPPVNLAYGADAVILRTTEPDTTLAPSVDGNALWYSVTPSLPTGLWLDPVTGAIRGSSATPVAAADYVITARNAGGAVTKTLSLSVVTPAPELAYADSAVYVKGQAITPLVPDTAGSGPVTSFSVTTALPAGLSLDGSTGVISGTPTAPVVATSYRVVAAGPGGNDTAIVVITVNDVAPVISYSTPHTYVAGAPIDSLKPASTGGVPVSYSMTPDFAGLTGLTFDTATGVLSGTPANGEPQGTYTIVAANSGGTDTAVVTLTVHGLPVIGSQPRDTTVTAGAAASFSVTASGDGTLSYQWRKNGTDIPSATEATYAIAAASNADSGAYTVVVASTLNGTVARDTSEAGTLFVNGGPTIAGQPRDTTVTASSGGSFTVSASGPGTLSYRWFRNDTVVPGETSATLVKDGIALADTGAFRVEVTSTVNGVASSAVSATVRLFVNVPPDVAAPRDTTVATGAAAFFTATVQGDHGSSQGVIAYRWMKNGEDVSAGGDSAILAVAAAALSDTGTYRVVVTRTLNGTVTADTSAAARLFVNAGPSIAALPEDTTVIAGAALSLTVSATGDGALTYKWRKGDTEIPGATGATLARTNVTSADTGLYRVAVTSTINGLGVSSLSDPVRLYVNTPPVIVTPPEPVQPIPASGEVTLSVVVDPAGGSSRGEVSYRWRKNGTDLADGGTVGGSATAVLTLTGATAADTGSYVVVVTRTLNGTTTSTTSAAGRIDVPVSIAPGSFVFRISGEDKPYAFRLPSGTAVERLTLGIFDTRGTMIWSKTVNPSKTRQTEISWNGRARNGQKASAGMYVVRISVQDGGVSRDYVRKSISLDPR